MRFSKSGFDIGTYSDWFLGFKTTNKSGDKWPIQWWSEKITSGEWDNVNSDATIVRDLFILAQEVLDE